MLDDPRLDYAARNPARHNRRPKGVEAKVHGAFAAAVRECIRGAMAAAQSVLQAENAPEQHVQPGKAAVGDPDLDGVDGCLHFVAPAARSEVELLQWVRCGPGWAALGHGKELWEDRDR